MMFDILYQDPYLIAVDKPARMHVHPPEDQDIRIPNRENLMLQLKKQTGLYLYPVHRLDRATSGVLIFALESSVAARLCGAFAKKEVQKKYIGVARGHLEENGIIERPLKRDSTDTLAESITEYKTLARCELSSAVGKYQTARYSLFEANPKTGRFHQIRRHMAGISHPIVGDTMHGDGDHNRFFRNELKISGLLLRAFELNLIHPISGNKIQIRTQWNKDWIKIAKLFSFSL